MHQIELHRSKDDLHRNEKAPGLPGASIATLFERAVYFFAAIIASRLARNALVLSQFGQLPSLATVLPTM